MYHNKEMFITWKRALHDSGLRVAQLRVAGDGVRTARWQGRRSLLISTTTKRIKIDTQRKQIYTFYIFCLVKYIIVQYRININIYIFLFSCINRTTEENDLCHLKASSKVASLFVDQTFPWQLAIQSPGRRHRSLPSPSLIL